MAADTVRVSGAPWAVRCAVYFRPLTIMAGGPLSWQAPDVPRRYARRAAMWAAVDGSAGAPWGLAAASLRQRAAAACAARVALCRAPARTPRACPRPRQQCPWAKPDPARCRAQWRRGQCPVRPAGRPDRPTAAVVVAAATAPVTAAAAAAAEAWVLCMALVLARPAEEGRAGSMTRGSIRSQGGLEASARAHACAGALSALGTTFACVPAQALHVRRRRALGAGRTA